MLIEPSAPVGYVKINEACPIAYRNEAANSQDWRSWDPYIPDGWAAMHAHGLDPYGAAC